LTDTAALFQAMGNPPVEAAAAAAASSTSAANAGVPN
jgi:hypothetical protein